MVGVQSGNAAGAVAALGGVTSLIICSANLPDKIAIAADTQMDDGLIERRHGARADCKPGSIRTINDGRSRGRVRQENGTNTYTLCRTL